MFILLLGDVVSYMWYQLCHLRPLLLYVFSFWMICPLISRMLNSSTIIVYLSIYPFIFIHFSSVQLLSHVQLFVIPWTTAHQAFLSPAPGVHPRPCPLSRWYHPTFSSLAVPFSSCPQSFPESGPFQISQLFASGGQSIGWIFRTDFFRMDWLDLLAVQGTLKRLLQNNSSKASILPSSAFFIVQFSHLYMTTGKTIALTRWTFVDKVMSLLFQMLSRLMVTFLPRSKHLLISWLQSPSAVIQEPRKIKSATVCTVSPSISQEAMGPDAMILVFWMLSFKPTFSLSCLAFTKRFFSSSSLVLWRRQWQPTPVLLPGKYHGWRSLIGCSPWGREELDTTEWLHFHFSLSCIREGNGNPLQCSCLKNPRDGGAWGAAIFGVAQSLAWLKWLSSSSSISISFIYLGVPVFGVMSSYVLVLICIWCNVLLCIGLFFII